MLIVAGRPWTDRVGAQQRVQRVTMQLGEFIQQRLGLGGSGEDAPHRRQGEGAEANGPLEGGTHVVALVLRHQSQELLRLQFALDLLGEQAVEELRGDGPQFAEALP
jgi:hypothetical protein